MSNYDFTALILRIPLIIEDHSQWIRKVSTGLIETNLVFPSVRCCLCDVPLKSQRHYEYPGAQFRYKTATRNSEKRSGRVFYQTEFVRTTVAGKHHWQRN